MSNEIYIDSSISNAQMTIGLNNASRIILGNTNCITSITGLMNVSNGYLNNASINLLNVTTLNVSNGFS